MVAGHQEATPGLWPDLGTASLPCLRVGLHEYQIAIPDSLPVPAELSAMAFSEGLNMECLMDHIVLNVEDDEKMITFYSKVLMMPPERLEEYHAGKAPFPSVRLNRDTIIDLFPKNMWQKGAQAEPGRENLNHFCIALSKRTWEDLLERLQANKVTIAEGPVPRWGAHGTGTSIYFRDPEGNLIEARYYERHKPSEKCLFGS
jgi:catechol 2,3-dioxygenase-like lactoylglutathione lyase family enzyme